MTGEDIFGAMYIPPPFKNMWLLVFSEQLPRFLCEKELTKLTLYERTPHVMIYLEQTGFIWSKELQNSDERHIITPYNVAQRQRK